MRKFLWIVAWALTAQGQACLNDIDTLRMAKEKFPEAVDVITGRFERNPPLYYQMRIDRLTPLVEKDPTRLGNYDDIAVAYDRIGDDKTAMVWMAKKKVQLDRLGSTAPEYHVYSYHANLGTFQIHDWLHRGAPVAEIKQAEQARDHIAKAIEIKPNAHFGREPVQLAVMKWIIDVKTGTNIGEFHPYAYTTLRGKPFVDGLMGLVVLGAAWESVDVFSSFGSDPYTLQKSTTLVRLARLRSEELVKNGKSSIVPLVNKTVLGGARYQDSLTDDYLRLRANAEEYNKNRQGFMLAKLRAGKHPDTDPDFWDGYKETPRYVPPWTFSEVTHRLGSTGMFFTSLTSLSALVIFLFVLVRRRIVRSLHA